MEFSSASRYHAHMIKHSGPPCVFALIAPYGNLAEVSTRLAVGLPCSIRVHEGFALDEAVTVALQAVAEDAPEVILSRGGTADYIRTSVDIPVVSVSTTALDLLRTLLPFAGTIGHVAFFNYQYHMPEVQTVARTLNMQIDEYLFHTRDDIASCMLEARVRGAQLGVGGVLVSQMQERCGLESLLLEAGEDAVQRALREAFAIAQVRRVELQRQVRMVTILNTIAEGILVTDEHNTLTHINPTAERILQISAHDITGRDARDVVPNTRTWNVLKSGKAELGEVQEISGRTIVTNRVPIIANGDTVGVVCTFAEAERIQQAEQRLRGKMRRKGFSARYTLASIITRDKAMQELKDLAQVYAATNATILLQGESGTGKELFAQGTHLASKRAANPFVAVNCAAIPEQLLESELFGYTEGAFTGANRQGKAGFFELAHEGTLFLDEISELPRPLQARLLRVLQEQEIVRVGGTQVIPINVRIVCATNQNLEEMTQEGLFRQDLYYRLNVLPLSIPPLRDRLEDIMLLAQHFLHEKAKTSQELAAPQQKGIQDIRNLLESYDWPGNVRELRNVMERLSLAASMFPKRSLLSLLEQVWQPTRTPHPEDNAPTPRNGNTPARPLKDMRRLLEKEIILRMLSENNGNHTKVAKILGVSRMSLWRKLNER